MSIYLTNKNLQYQFGFDSQDIDFEIGEKITQEDGNYYFMIKAKNSNPYFKGQCKATIIFYNWK